jgi:hypothetical protein
MLLGRLGAWDGMLLKEADDIIEEVEDEEEDVGLVVGTPGGMKGQLMDGRLIDGKLIDGMDGITIDGLGIVNPTGVEVVEVLVDVWDGKMVDDPIMETVSIGPGIVTVTIPQVP